MSETREGKRKIPDDETKEVGEDRQINNAAYSVFVVYDESDEFADNDILLLLEKENLSFCCVRRQGDPGNTRLGDFSTLLLQSKKVLFVVSKLFTQNEELVFFVEVALDLLNHNTQNIITLITDGTISYRNNLQSLNQTTKISVRHKLWKTNLINTIQKVNVHYCTLLETGKVSDQLLLRGLCALTLRWEVYGLLVVAAEQYLKVDLIEYTEHIQHHHDLDMNKFCEQCGFLTHVNTTINLAFCDSFVDGQLATIKDDVIQMCVGLLDACSLMKTQTEWLIVCSVTGTYEKNQQEYISDLFAAAKSAVETNYTAKASDSGKLHLPEYVDEAKRLESFQGVWPQTNVPTAEVMARSGFVFMMKPDVAQCFSCGYNQCCWDPSKDPLVVHAQVTPACKFVRDNVNPEMLPKKMIKGSTKNEKYSDFNQRLSSLKSSHLLENEAQHPERDVELSEIADSGFYFIGYNMIKCFSCGVSVVWKDNVQSWSSEIAMQSGSQKKATWSRRSEETTVSKSSDNVTQPRASTDVSRSKSSWEINASRSSDIWNLHATLSPNCEYLLRKKGDHFINTINFSNKQNSEPTIVTLFLVTLKGEKNIDWPGFIFLPGERYKYAPNE